ncbi:MAG: MoaD/ThiS family protein [Acidimicrobiales bacterium]
MIRVELPAHLRRLATISGDVKVAVDDPVTIAAVVSAIEADYPVLRGTIRDSQTLRRRPYVRFYAAGLDLSHESGDHLVPDEVVAGSEPFIVLGAISGG